MRRITLLLFVLVASSAFGQTAAFNGFCTTGGTAATTQSLNSTNKLQGIIPLCTVTVYLTGTTTKATIFADGINTSLGNPFTASTKGQWLFWSALSQGVDVVLSGGGGVPTCTTAPNCYTSPVTLTNLIVGGGGGGGGSSPAPPSYAVQFANVGASALASDPNIQINPTTHTLTAYKPGISTANTVIAWGMGTDAASFSGTPGQQIDAACATFAGAAGTVIVPYGMAAGTTVVGLPSKCHLIDYRGNTLMEPYGIIDGNETNATVFNSAESTPSNLTPNAYVGFAGIQIAYQALAGGNNSFNGTSGSKTNYIPLFLSAGFRTVGQKQGIANNVWSFSAGDTLPFGNSVYQFGGYGTNGDEQTVGIENLFYQGLAAFSNTDGAGGSGSGTITNINSSTGVVTYTPGLLETTMGEQRFIRDMGSVVTGTYTNAVNTGSAPTTVTITGTGFSALSGYATNPHTTWNSLSTGGQILTNNAVFCADPAAAGGYDGCFPVNAVSSDTTLTLNLYATGSAMNTGWAWATSGTYHLYKSAWPTNVNIYNHTFTACSPNLVPSSGNCDVSGLTNGHNWDQVVAYNMLFTGQRIAFQHPMGFPYKDVAFDVQNQTARPAEAALTVEGSMLAAMEVGAYAGLAPNSLIQINQRGSSGNATMFPDRTSPAANQWSITEYNRSDGQGEGKPIWFDSNAASITEGVNFFNAMNIPSPGPGGASRGVNLPVINGGVQVGSVFNVQAGVLGSYSNLLTYSQFDSANPSWTLGCALPNPATITANTTDVTDPLPPFGNTAEKFVSQAVTGTGCGSVVSSQQQVVTFPTAGVPYTVTIWARGAVGGEVVILGFSAGGVAYDNQLPLLTTSWKQYSFTAIPASVSGTNSVSFATGITSSTIYVADAQMVQSGSAGYPVHTVATPIAPITGLNVQSVIDSSLTPGTSIICPNGTNGEFTTSGCVTPALIASGTVTSTTGTVTTAHTFGTAFGTTPVCTASPYSNSGAWYFSTLPSTTSSGVITYAATGAQTFGEICSGPGGIW